MSSFQTTLYSAASYGLGGMDMHFRAIHEKWAEAWAMPAQYEYSARTLNDVYTGAYIPAEQGGSNISWYFKRTGVVFDTSGIPLNANLSNASLAFWLDRVQSWSNADALAVGDFNPKSMSTTSLYDNQSYSTTEYAERLTLASQTTQSWITVLLNSNFLSALSRQGFTGVGFRTSYDMDNNPFAWSSTNSVAAFLGAADGSNRSFVLSLNYDISTRSFPGDKRRTELYRPPEAFEVAPPTATLSKDVYVPTTPRTLMERQGDTFFTSQLLDIVNQLPTFFAGSTTSGPNSAMSAKNGAFFVDYGSAEQSKLWFKESGSGNTGWKQVDFV